jgi:plastocyanin
MRLRALIAALAVLLVAVPAAEAGAAGKAKYTCHWVKATKKRKRHKVCVKVKAMKKAPAKAAAPSTTAPASAPAPVAATPAPVAPAPVVDPAAAVPAAPVTPTPPDPAPAVPAAPARVQATTKEWSITLSRPTVAAGAVVLQLVNRGEDAHDLHVRPESGGGDVLALPSTASGAVADVSGTLPAGRYTLYCSLPGHEAAGMHATLTVQ